MSTAENVRDAWAALFATSGIQNGYTDKVYPYEVTTGSEAETALLTSTAGRKISFIEFVVSRELTREGQEIGGLQVPARFLSEIRYTLEKQVPGEPISGDAHQQVEDFFDYLTSAVNTTLGNTWSGTVDRYEWSGAPQVLSEKIGERDCWRGVIRFTGFGFTSL